MKKLELDILKAEILINKIYDYQLTLENYHYFDRIYPFTTENIKGYYDLLDFKNKDVLTVGSSGDHTLNLYLENVKSVDFFDINSFSKYYFDLKYSAIKALTYEDYLSYFCYVDFPKISKYNNNCFDINLYHKIQPYLNNNSKYFWDNLYLENTGLEIRSSDMFLKDEESISILKKINNYLKEENYYYLQDNIDKYSKYRFYNDNIKNIRLNKKYDIIMLSNIAQYLQYIYPENQLENFKYTINILENYLNEQGIILISYLYDINHSQYRINDPIIYDIEQVHKLFDIELLKFNGIEGIKYHQQNPIKDGIIVYKKTKK